MLQSTALCHLRTGLPCPSPGLQMGQWYWSHLILHANTLCSHNLPMPEAHESAGMHTKNGLKKERKGGKKKRKGFLSKAYRPRRNPLLWIHLRPVPAKCVSSETLASLASGILQAFLSSQGASSLEPSSSKTQQGSWQLLSHRPSGIWSRPHRRLWQWGQQRSSGFSLPGWAMSRCPARVRYTWVSQGTTFTRRWYKFTVKTKLCLCIFSTAPKDQMTTW